MNQTTNTTAGIDLDAAQLDKLEALARAATPGPWMRLFGERTVYDRMEDGCRGNTIVRADTSYSSQDAANLDFIAAANPATVLQLIQLARRTTSGNDACAAMRAPCEDLFHAYRRLLEVVDNPALDRVSKASIEFAMRELSQWFEAQSVGSNVVDLTAAEYAFVDLVRQRSGHKLNGPEVYDADGNPLWKRPEELGLIRAIGCFKWIVSGATPRNPVIEAVHGTPVDSEGGHHD